MIPYSEVTESTGGQFSAVPVADATRYAAEDAHITWLLHQALAKTGELRDNVLGTMGHFLCAILKACLQAHASPRHSTSPTALGSASGLTQATHREDGEGDGEGEGERETRRDGEGEGWVGEGWKFLVVAGVEALSTKDCKAV